MKRFTSDVYLVVFQVCFIALAAFAIWMAHKKGTTENISQQQSVERQDVERVEEEDTYFNLTGAGRLIHIFPGNECCWMEADSVHAENGALYISVAQYPIVIYQGQYMLGSIRIQSCQQCQIQLVY